MRSASVAARKTLTKAAWLSQKNFWAVWLWHGRAVLGRRYIAAKDRDLLHPRRALRGFSMSTELLVQAAQKEVLDAYRREFDLLSSGFRDLDGKAQGTAAVAGAFLAAGLALFNRSAGTKDLWMTSTLIIAVCGLVGAIFLAIQALRVRKILGCPSGDEVSRLLTAIQGSPVYELEQRLVYFYGDTADLWRSCVNNRRKANENKAHFIWLAQVSLASSSLCVAILIVGSILTR
jgi:hypothetical protein